jgi:thiol-disulfide isomerase/thioredoxin
MLTEVLVSMIVVLAFIGIYYAITGTPPGARVIEQDIPITSNGLEDHQAKFMFFYTTWCPHCTDAKEPLASFKQMVKNQKYTYGGKTISFEDINAESDKGKSALYKIGAYPTFKVETNKKVYEMIGKPSPATFRAFLTKALGPEKIA